MKLSRTMSRIISAARDELQWPVLERTHDQPVVRVISNPRERSHIIYLPAWDQQLSGDLDYLHEVGHALFCERYHPLFAANAYFSQSTRKRDFEVIAPALSAAVDWFLSSWMAGLAPRRTKDQWRENLQVAEEILQKPTLPPFEVFLDSSLAIAQVIHFCRERIDCGGVLKDAVDAFLTTPPDSPGVEAVVTLVNRLLSFATDKRARLVNDGEFDIWELYIPESVGGRG